MPGTDEELVLVAEHLFGSRNFGDLELNCLQFVFGRLWIGWIIDDCGRWQYLL